MKNVSYKMWLAMGTVTYWACYPLLALYINKDNRTRILVWHDGKLLLVKSWLDSGKWYLPGGGLHGPEDPAHGALRELSEETGIDATKNELINLGEYQYNQGLMRYMFYGFELKLKENPQLKLQRYEISDTIWLSREDALKLPLHSSYKQMITRSKLA